MARATFAMFWLIDLPEGHLEGSIEMIRTTIAAAAIAAVLAAPADAQPRRIQVGSLNCSMSAGIGLVVGSQRNVSCYFNPGQGAPQESYAGTMTRIGLDVGFTSGSQIVWGVFADTNRYSGMLAGTYAGATAEMTIAAGLGANVLVGGSNRTVALQPLSVQGQVGLNIAAGIGALELHLVR
jgi:hypothetical protein